MDKPSREEWALIISEGHGLSSADLKAIREGSERIGVSIVNVDEDGNFMAPHGILTTHLVERLQDTMYHYPRSSFSGPSIDDQLQINKTKGELSRAKMQRNKHLIRDLEAKLSRLVNGAFK